MKTLLEIIFPLLLLSTAHGQSVSDYFYPKGEMTYLNIGVGTKTLWYSIDDNEITSSVSFEGNDISRSTEILQVTKNKIVSTYRRIVNALMDSESSDKQTLLVLPIKGQVSRWINLEEGSRTVCEARLVNVSVNIKGKRQTVSAIKVSSTTYLTKDGKKYPTVVEYWVKGIGLATSKAQGGNLTTSNFKLSDTDLREI